MPIDLLALGAAFVTALAGGLHCVAMCGGIATGFAVLLPSEASAWRHAAWLNAGRVLGYATAGALAGALGNSVLAIARSPWLAHGARLAAGALLVFAALRLFDRGGKMRWLSKPGGTLWHRLRPLQRTLLPANTVPKKLALGALWGWMPCGLSTTLLAVAWLQADAVQGAAIMLAFGLGTLPLMLALTRSGETIGAALRRPHFRHAAGSMVLASGLATAGAPWLAQVPALHRTLAALGCLA